MGSNILLLLELEGTIWKDDDNQKTSRLQERLHLLNKIYGVSSKNAQEAILYLDEVTQRYKRHFKVLSPYQQLATIFHFLGIPEREICAFSNLWFEVLIKFPPRIDYAFLSTLEQLKREKHIAIVGFSGLETESEEYIKELLSIEGFLHVFHNVISATSMKFIPPSPLAFFHVSPSHLQTLNVGIATKTDTLKSMVLAGYKHVYMWSLEGGENSIFETLTTYREIIQRISNI